MTFIDSLQECPIDTNSNLSKEISPNFEKIFHSSEYMYCDKGNVYCGTQMKNITSTKCINECLSLNYEYAGTMDK